MLFLSTISFSYEQVRAFKCCATCCSDKHSSQQVVQGCLQSCMQPVKMAEEQLSGEVQQLQVRVFVRANCNIYSSHLQERLTRCAQECRDSVSDQLSPSPSQEERERLNKQAEACLMQCADKHIPLINKMVARVRQHLDTCQ